MEMGIGKLHLDTYLSCAEASRRRIAGIHLA
jgi:hypothetical protein